MSTCICAMLQQHLRNLMMACSCCLKQGCLAIAVLRMHTGTSPDEQLHSLCLTAVGCQVESSCAILQHTYRVSTPCIGLAL